LKVPIGKRVGELLLYGVFLFADAEEIWPHSRLLALCIFVVGTFGLLLCDGGFSTKQIAAVVAGCMAASVVLYFVIPGEKPDAPRLDFIDVRFLGGAPLQVGPLNIEWRIINNGKADAVISDAKTTPVVTTGVGRLPDTPIYEHTTRNMKGMRIVAGIPFPGATETSMSLTQEQVEAIKAGTSRLYYYGYIKYGTDSEFAFIAAYDPHVGGFVRDEDEYPTYSRAE
jgi:hypothetical protein